LYIFQTTPKKKPKFRCLTMTYGKFQPLRCFYDLFCFYRSCTWWNINSMWFKGICSVLKKNSKPKIELLVCLLYPKYINFPQSTSMTWHLVEGKGIKIKPSSEMAGLAHIIWHIYSSRCNNFPNWMSYDWHYAWCAMCSGLSSPVLLDVLADFARMFQLLRLTHVWN